MYRRIFWKQDDRIMRAPTRFTSILTFSNVLAVISACIALTATTTAIYYNFYWHPEQLQVSYRTTFQKLDRSHASFVFTNNGRQSIAIETVKLMKAMESISDEACDIANRYARQRNGEISSWEDIETFTKDAAWDDNRVQDKQRPELEYFNSAFEIEKPITISVDNKESQSTSLLVEAQSARLLNVDYAVSIDGSKDEVYCFQINVFDRAGRYHTRILPAWQVIKKRNSDPYDFTIHYGQGMQRFSLLPAP